MKEKLTVDMITQLYKELRASVKFNLFFNLFLYIVVLGLEIASITLIFPVTNIIIGVLLCFLIFAIIGSAFLIIKETINNIKTLRKIKLRINQLQTGDFALEKDVLQQKVLKNNRATGILENSTDVLFLTEQEFNEVDSGSIVYRVKFADTENKSVYGPYYFNFLYNVSALLT